MTIQYWLFIAFAGQMQIAGPFHGLVACEKAAAQVTIAAREAASGALPATVQLPVGTACLSQKHANFKYKEPK